MSNIGYIYLACCHDRHTDDVYKAFLILEDAKNQCREWMSFFPSAIENQQYGDWCLYVEESYHAFVQKVELVSDDT